MQGGECREVLLGDVCLSDKCSGSGMGPRKPRCYNASSHSIVPGMLLLVISLARKFAENLERAMQL